MILVTGVAGFIGMHVALALLKQGKVVLGIDNLNDYYDVTLKQARLAQLSEYPNFRFLRIELSDAKSINDLWASHKIQQVVHLAAQAGVRYSLEKPQAYIDSNITGFLNILEASRHFGVEHLVYASSSSVYGGTVRLPFSESHSVDHPVSLYAATKKSNELMAHTYSHLFQIPTTGLRFFTVYGPWGRPDMSPMLFASAILNGEVIRVFNQGQMERDFTYIDDVVEVVLRVLDKAPTAQSNLNMGSLSPDRSWAPYRIFNVGQQTPVSLMRFIELLEQLLGKQTQKEFLPMQAGDIRATAADARSLLEYIDYEPHTSLEIGLGRFADWYLNEFRRGH